LDYNKRVAVTSRTRVFTAKAKGSTMTTLSDIEKLVQTTAKNALEKDTPLQERIDALKVIAPYYTALKKAAGQEPAEGGDEPTMDDMRSQIEESGNGRNVQARTRSRGN
jgi:hypothetical protein